MKKYILAFSCLLCLSSYGQSLSVTKLTQFLESQDFKIIESKLIAMSFVVDSKNKEYNTITTTYFKKGSLGSEMLIVGKSDEIFSLVYKPSKKQFYSVLKQKFLTNDFKHAFSAKGHVFYESDYMRIGIKDSSNILNLIVNLNN
ncbi:hypothetical protein ACXGQW_03110 [Wenyingzhuangia sp. IMCC45533]